MRTRTPILILAGLLAITGYVQLVDRNEAPPFPVRLPPNPEGWSLAQPKNRPAFMYSPVRFKMGDDPAWAQPAHDDSSWEPLTPWDTPARAGIFWVRWRVRAASPEEPLPPGIYITAVSAYEIFWDGAPLGRNGTPGNSAAEERPGRVDRAFPLSPTQVAPGEHMVAMRVSTHLCGFPHPKSGFIHFMESPVAVFEWRALNALIPTLAAGAMFVLAITAGIFWSFDPRRREMGWAVLLCTFASAMQALSVIRWVVNYRSDWYHLVIYGGTALHGLMAFSLLALVTTHLAVPRARWWWIVAGLGMLVVAQSTPPVRNTEGAFMMVVACAFVVAAAAYTLRRGNSDARYVLIGALASGLWIALDPRSYTWTGFLPRFLPTLIGATLMLASAARRDRVEAEHTRQVAARLELELLKKNLQPHFLLNTLTALSELVEQRPADAVGLIEDLAGEFRLIASMSTERTVPLAQELALCRTHLRVLGVRTGREYRLDVENLADEAPVPPAVFLTLIENAFSHQRAGDGPVVFRLQGERDSHGTTHYRFLSPGAVTAEAPKPGGGTGLRYVRARLEECFPQSWSFSDGATADGWLTRITIGPTRTAS